MKLQDRTQKSRWILSLSLSSLLSFLLLITIFNISLFSTHFFIFSSKTPVINSKNQTQQVPVVNPRLAYLISGSTGDLERLWRVLLALYHPMNQYLLHIDMESPESERAELRQRVEEEPLFVTVGNVQMINSNLVTYRGSTMVSNTLHGCAVLLQKSKDWDWFINLSASDYPLLTQDDILHVFSNIPRNLNFVEHNSTLGWMDNPKIGFVVAASRLFVGGLRKVRARPVMIDPGLYSSTKSNVFIARGRRALPSSFKIFTGSAWVALTRAFVEYCILGLDNLPRTLLMYFANYLSSPESYFQTVICNSPSFNTTVVNHDLHYISWTYPRRQHPGPIIPKDNTTVIASGAPFARKFPADSPVLDLIDVELLGRSKGRVTPGGWCSGEPPCSKVGNASVLNLTRGYKRVNRMVRRLVKQRKNNMCL